MKSNHLILTLFIAFLYCLVVPGSEAVAMPTRITLEDDNNRTCKITVLKYTGEPQKDVYAKVFGNINKFEADDNGVITIEYDKSYTYTASIYFNDEPDTYKKTVSLDSEIGEMSVYFERQRDIMEYKRVARVFPIEGMVTDSDGNPIEGATVSVQGTGRRTLTDEIGLFQIEADFNHSVNFRADGMDNKSLPITHFFKDDGDINITMYRKNNWEVYGSAEKMPEFPGGMQAYQDYITKNLVYPEKAKRKKTEGVVVVQFVVETNGFITNPRIARHLEESLDSVAKSLIAGMPRWTPASDFGTAVRCKYSLPVAFKIPKPEPVAPAVKKDSMATHMLAMDSLKHDSLSNDSLPVNLHAAIQPNDSLQQDSLLADSTIQRTATQMDSLAQDSLQQDSTRILTDKDQPTVKVKKRNAFVRFFRWLFGIERRQRKRAEKELMLKAQNDSIHAVDSLVKALPKASMEVSEDSIRLDVDSLNINVKDLEKKAKELMK